MPSSPEISATTLYWLVGVMVVMNAGTFITVLGAALRASWWLSKLDSRVERNRYDVNNAHEKIRAIEGRIK